MASLALSHRCVSGAMTSHIAGSKVKGPHLHTASASFKPRLTQTPVLGAEHLEAAKMNYFQNHWGHIYDFTPKDGNWTFLPEVNRLQPLFAANSLCPTETLTHVFPSPIRSHVIRGASCLRWARRRAWLRQPTRRVFSSGS